MIILENLRKTYSLGGEDVHALDGISLTVEDHEFVAIVGASGSGKSTLMNMIGCLDVPDEGTYTIDGEDVFSMTEKQLAVLRNRKIGFIFQQFNLLPKMTAWENVELPLIYQGLPAAERKKRVEEELTRVGLEGRMHHRPNQLSGGQQQRVAVARALATHPSLLLADEPTGNLDSKSTADIMNLLKELHRNGNTIILITHDDEVAQQAERQVRIMDGKIIADSAEKSAPAEGRTAHAGAGTAGAGADAGVAGAGAGTGGAAGAASGAAAGSAGLTSGAGVPDESGRRQGA